MKLNGIFGKGSGKVGSSVFAVSGGEQIVRQYNPNVSNPSTNAQVQQRAKFKLLSQLAADLAPALAIKKQGMRSARNQFVSTNFWLTDFQQNTAQLDYTQLQLTDGKSAMPPIVKGENTTVMLQNADSGLLNAVVYVFCMKDEEDQIRVMGIKPAINSGNGFFETSYAEFPDAEFVYAYGLKFNSSASRSRYENYFIEESNGIANLNTALAEAIAGSDRTSTTYLSLE